MIEIERVKIIKKRAVTSLRHCDGCGVVSDTVSHVEAAKLFETGPARLIQFIKDNNCHHDVSYEGKTYICVASLLERIKEKNNSRLLMAQGD